MTFLVRNPKTPKPHCAIIFLYNLKSFSSLERACLMANINVLIPPGATSSYAAQPVDQNVSTRLSNPNTIDKRIQEARLQDNMKR